MVVVSSLIVWAAAATFLTLSNTATITLGASLDGVTAGVTSTTTCSSLTGYGNPPAPISWGTSGTVLTGTTAQAFICLHNIGTDNYPVSIASNLPTTQGTISTLQSGSVVAPNLYLLVELDWSIPRGAPLGPVSFTITFQ